MRNKAGIVVLIIIVILLILLLTQILSNQKTSITDFDTDDKISKLSEEIDVLEDTELIPIQIDYLKNLEYPGSELTIERQLVNGGNYEQYIASYLSEGLKQYGLLTKPLDDAPSDGYPAIIFNHGYIDPDVYQTTQRYESYQDYFASRGYVVFKPDYRGHGDSEGVARGGYGNSDYIIDVLNAFTTIQKLDYVNSNAIGMWGHSMGGWITHRSMVVSPDIKVGVIWAGMVGGYDDLIELRQPWWIRNNQPEPTQDPENPRRRWRSYLQEVYGSPDENQEFWNSISAVSYLDNLSGPIQLHHGTGDESVPVILSEKFYENLEPYSNESELYIYEGDDHNISNNFSIAMQRSIGFFDKYLKQ